MDMTIRNDVIRAPEIETPAAAESGVPSDSPLFGDLLAEVRQRDNSAGEDDQRTPASDATAAGPLPAAAQPVPAARQQDTAPDAPETAEAAEAIGSSGSADSAAAAPASTADALSPGRFLAMLDTATATGSATAAQAQGWDASALPAAASAAPSSAAAETVRALPAATATVEPHLRSPEWPAAFGNTVRLLVSDQAQVARIRLSPEDLGPVDVRITVSDNRAEIAFAVSSPEARAAIQQALPQLREALAGSGLQLGDTAFGQTPADSDRGDEAAAGGSPAGARPDGVNGEAAIRPVTIGLVDLYA